MIKVVVDQSSSTRRQRGLFSILRIGDFFHFFFTRSCFWRRFFHMVATAPQNNQVDTLSMILTWLWWLDMAIAICYQVKDYISCCHWANLKHMPSESSIRRACEQILRTELHKYSTLSHLRMAFHLQLTPKKALAMNVQWKCSSLPQSSLSAPGRSDPCGRPDRTCE